MKIAIGSDHAGFEMRTALLTWLQTPEGGRHRVLDVGCGSTDSCDYPDFAAAVGRAVATHRVSKGILLCGTGIGMAMAANKIDGVRAAVVWTPDVARLTVEHNDANVICLPARFASVRDAQDMTRAFLEAHFAGGRHRRRVKKIIALEAAQK